MMQRRLVDWMVFAWLLLCWRAVSSPTAEPPQGGAYLTVAFESTDVSHVACLLEYPGQAPRWLGFGPRMKYKLAAAGGLHTGSLENELVRYVRFRLAPADLQRAEAVVRRRYAEATYLIGIRDCVTFVIDLAAAAGLEVPHKGHWCVAHVVDELASRNRRRVDASDELPYPWTSTPRQRDLTSWVTVRVEYVDCREAASCLVRDRLYLIAVDDRGNRRRIEVGKLGDGERWRGSAVLFHLPRGSRIGLQLWEADRWSADDLVFQTSFPVDRDGRFGQTQTRGRAATLSTSIYRVGISVAPFEPSSGPVLAKQRDTD